MLHTQEGRSLLSVPSQTCSFLTRAAIFMSPKNEKNNNYSTPLTTIELKERQMIYKATCLLSKVTKHYIWHFVYIQYLYVYIYMFTKISKCEYSMYKYEYMYIYTHYIFYIFIYTISPPCPWIQPTAYKKSQKKSRSSKININLPCSNNYLHSIDTVLIYTLLLLALGIISNSGDNLRHTEDMCVGYMQILCHLI